MNPSVHSTAGCQDSTEPSQFRPTLGLRRRGLAGRDGFLALLVMVLLSFFGTLAGLQVLLHASAGLSSRALEHRRQRIQVEQSTRQALGEAVLSFVELGRPAPGKDFAATLRDRLDSLALDAVTVEECPALAAKPVLFPDLNEPPAALAVPSDALLAAATPDLRDLMGNRVSEVKLGPWRFSCEQRALGGKLTFDFACETWLVSSPLTRHPFLGYELPDEVALSGGSAPVKATSLGLAPSRDASSKDALRAEADSLPYYFRRRASLAAAYQYVLSQAYVDRLASYAGPTHCLDLDVATASAPVLDGFTRVAGACSFDLGKAGRGVWNGIDERREVFLVSSSLAGRTLRLFDSTAQTDASPLVLLVMGTAANPVQVDLETVARPVCLLAFNAVVRAASGVSWNGALVLSKSSSFSSQGSGVRLAHFSYWAGSAGVDTRLVQTDLAMPVTLEALIPRVTYVLAGPSEP